MSQDPWKELTKRSVFFFPQESLLIQQRAFIQLEKPWKQELQRVKGKTSAIWYKVSLPIILKDSSALSHPWADPACRVVPGDMLSCKASA